MELMEFLVETYAKKTMTRKMQLGEQVTLFRILRNVQPNFTKF